MGYRLRRFRVGVVGGNDLMSTRKFFDDAAAYSATPPGDQSDWFRQR
jgi:hypothetical protein